MRVLIIGIGSIALKHITALRELDSTIEIFGLRSNKESSCVDGVNDLYSWDEVPNNIDFVIISNPTTEHYNAIKKAIKLQKPLMIEKPPLSQLEGADELIQLLESKKILTYVAFPLRFNPALKWLGKNLAGKRIYELSAYCGSYLPDWRPNRDYRTIYSAKKDLGGGVHLDIIHELDYVIWLLGTPEKSTSFFSKVSDLEIDSFDSAHYWLSYPNKNASVTLNYYRKDSCREITIVMADDTWKVDLLTNEIKDSSGNILFKAEPSQKSMYYNQLEYFLNCIRNNEVQFNSFKDALETLKICLS